MDLRMIKVTAAANQDIIPLIFAELENEGEKHSEYQLDYIGFEATAGTTFKINDNSMEVPSNGHFVTPYEGDRYLRIRQFSFNAGCTAQNVFYII